MPRHALVYVPTILALRLLVDVFIQWLSRYAHVTTARMMGAGAHRDCLTASADTSPAIRIDTPASAA